MARYVTKQRKILLEYLTEHTDETLTPSKIALDLADKGISTSAVYRNIADLEAEKLLRRVDISGARETYYQYIGKRECKECLHLSCVKCGKTFHLENQITNQLLSQVEESDCFKISKEKTVLYGVCKNCN